jgi:hypothetical protein
MGCEDQVRCCCAEKPNPETCTPEQISECHGDAALHPCRQGDAAVDADEAPEATSG